ncbi:alpha/beta hydrolase [soil metagenome]
MISDFDVRLDDHRVVHGYSIEPGNPSGDDRLAVCWHHGTSNIGSPPRPLFDAADRLGLRWFSFDRPGYGGSTAVPGRAVADVAELAAAVADARGIDRFAVMGHSGGGPHALACAAHLSDRVVAAVSGAGLAPFTADGLDWFAGMTDSGVASLTSAAAGRDAKERFEASGAEYDPEFTSADLEMLAGEWGWLGEVVGPAVAGGPGGLIADDLAYVSPWGFEPAEVTVPTLLIHGTADRVVPCAHSEWLTTHCPDAELRLADGDVHLSVLRHAVDALEWIRNHA